MTIYMILLAVIAAFSALVSSMPKEGILRARTQSFLSIVVGLFLTVILTLRDHSVGVDVQQYLFYWEAASTHDLSEISRFEPTFLALIGLSRLISNSSQFFLALAAILAIAPISFTIRKTSPLPLMSWFVYICLGFYAFTFSGLRQAIAYGFTFLAIYLIQRKKPMLFVVAVVAASTFHLSALVFLPAYFIYWIRLGRLGVTLYLIAVPIIFLFRDTIYLVVTTYFYSNYELAPSSSYNWLILSGAIMGILWGVLYLSSRNGRKHARTIDAIGLLQLATVGVTIMLFASVGTNIMRVADYYYIAIVLALPVTLTMLPKNQQSFMRLCTILLLSVIFISQMMHSPYSIVPYVLHAD